MDDDNLNGSEVVAQPTTNFSFAQLPIGTVIRTHVVDTNPPKVKRFVIVGYYQGDAITIYFNSDINEFHNYSLELKNLHIPFDNEGRSYISHYCYCDCSILIKRNNVDLHAAVAANPSIVIGCLSDSDLTNVKATLAGSPNLKGGFKKKYGFYN